MNSNFPNDFHKKKYGMAYRNFTRTLPQAESKTFELLLKTLQVCLFKYTVENKLDFSDFIDYLKLIGTDIYENMNDSDTAYSMRKFTETSICRYLIDKRIDTENLESVFYEDAFLLISHECQEMQNKQVEHLVGKKISGIEIKKLSDIICYPHPYFLSFWETVKRTQRPNDAISLKLNYVVNELDTRISPDSFGELVDLMIRISSEIYHNVEYTNSRTGVELLLYVKYKIEQFLKENNISLTSISNMFYDECFLIVIYKIQDELEKENSDISNKTENMLNVARDLKSKDDKSDAVCSNRTHSILKKEGIVKAKKLSKLTAYVLAVVSCLLLLFAYTALGSLAFGWKSGGGYIPLVIFGACEVALWKWIVGKARN